MIKNSFKYSKKNKKKYQNQHFSFKGKNCIIHVVNSNIYSGLETVVCEIIKSEKNYNSIYVTQAGPIVDILKKEKINYEIIRKMSFLELKRVLKKYNPEIIHSHDYTASFFCSLVKGNSKLIEHIHNNSLWIRRLNLKTIIFLFAAWKANLILTVSDSISKEYIFSKYIKNKIINISNPVSYDNIKTKIIKSEKIYDICCVGRITEAKNPFRFVDIIKQISLKNPLIKAIWVGDGELKEQLKDYILNCNMENNIILVGYSNNPYDYICKSKFFMLTSKWEGFGLVAFEALACGVPCIVSNVGGLKEIVDDSCGRLCTSNNDFVDAVFSFNEYAKYKKLSSGAIKKAKLLTNFDTYMSKLDQIYKEVLNEKN